MQQQASSDATRIRVLVADDSELMRTQLRRFVDVLPGVDLAALARDGREAIALAESSRPDLILMDFRMPGMSGVEAMSLIKKRRPDVKVIIVTTYDDESVRRMSLERGADGFVSKSELHREMKRTICEFFPRLELCEAEPR